MSEPRGRGRRDKRGKPPAGRGGPRRGAAASPRRAAGQRPKVSDGYQEPDVVVRREGVPRFQSADDVVARLKRERDAALGEAKRCLEQLQVAPALQHALGALKIDDECGEAARIIGRCAGLGGEVPRGLRLSDKLRDILAEAAFADVEELMRQRNFESASVVLKQVQRFATAGLFASKGVSAIAECRRQLKIKEDAEEALERAEGDWAIVVDPDTPRNLAIEHADAAGRDFRAAAKGLSGREAELNEAAEMAEREGVVLKLLDQLEEAIRSLNASGGPRRAYEAIVAAKKAPYEAFNASRIAGSREGAVHELLDAVVAIARSRFDADNFKTVLAVCASASSMFKAGGYDVDEEIIDLERRAKVAIQAAQTPPPLPAPTKKKVTYGWELAAQMIEALGTRPPEEVPTIFEHLRQNLSLIQENEEHAGARGSRIVREEIDNVEVVRRAVPDPERLDMRKLEAAFRHHERANPRAAMLVLIFIRRLHTNTRYEDPRTATNLRKAILAEAEAALKQAGDNETEQLNILMDARMYTGPMPAIDERLEKIGVAPPKAPKKRGTDVPPSPAASGPLAKLDTEMLEKVFALLRQRGLELINENKIDINNPKDFMTAIDATLVEIAKVFVYCPPLIGTNVAVLGEKWNFGGRVLNLGRSLNGTLDVAMRRDDKVLWTADAGWPRVVDHSTYDSSKGTVERRDVVDMFEEARGAAITEVRALMKDFGEAVLSEYNGKSLGSGKMNTSKDSDRKFIFNSNPLLENYLDDKKMRSWLLKVVGGLNRMKHSGLQSGRGRHQWFDTDDDMVKIR